MFNIKPLQIVTLSVAAIGLALAGPTAWAGHDDYRSTRDVNRCDYPSNNGYSRNQGYSSGTSFSYRSSDVRVVVSSGSTYRSDCRPASYPVYRAPSCPTDYPRDYSVYRNPTQGDCRTVYHDIRSGYWQRAYVPPVYDYRYDSCGRLVRVCVREGYYDRVWVSTGRY